MIMTTAQKEQIVSNYIEAYNTFDTTRMLYDLSHDIHFENSSNGEVTMTLHGLDEFRKQAEEATALFTERKQSIVNFKHDHDKTETSIHYHAVLAIDLPNGMKKGNVLNLKGKSVFTFSGDKIVRIEDIS
jgi:hypothetical protein